jgi:hypothetical protein
VIEKEKYLTRGGGVGAEKYQKISLVWRQKSNFALMFFDNFNFDKNLFLSSSKLSSLESMHCMQQRDENI